MNHAFVSLIWVVLRQTELCKALSQFLFDTEEAMIR
jgi:hypothetical protein